MEAREKKRRKRWPYWLGGSILTVLIVGYIGWNYAIDYFISSMVSGFEEEIEAYSPPDSNSPKGTTGEGGKETQPPTDGAATPDAPNEDNGSSGEQPVPDKDSSGDQPVNKDTPVSNTGGSQSSGTTPGSSGGGGGSSSNTGSGSGGTKGDTQPSEPKYDPTVSEEKAKDVQESMTTKEKAQVTAVLMKKLGPSDISLLMKLASGGMSLEDKKEAKKIFLEKLTEEEYDQLIGIAAKYELSQGKSYAQSKKE